MLQAIFETMYKYLKWMVFIVEWVQRELTENFFALYFPEFIKISHADIW